MKRMSAPHLLSGLLALFLAGAGWLSSRRLTLQGLEDGLGAAFFPWMILLAMALLGVALLAAGMTAGAGEAPTVAKDRRMIILAVAGSLVVYGFLLVPLGFELATAVFLLVTAWLLGAGPARAGVFALLATAALWAVFGLVLRVPLP